MIDLHSHILPGIDDGPDTFEESLALARAAAAGGTRTIVATPHVSWRYPNEAGTIAPLVQELGARLRTEGIALEVLAGAEIAASRVAEIDSGELQALTLGGGNWLLLEPPFVPAAYGLDAAAFSLQRLGHGVIVAHPERCPAFHRDPKALGALVEAGVLTSITAGSLVGRFGRAVRRFAGRMLREGIVHNVASDAHDTGRRPPTVLSELEQAGLAPLGEWLTQSVPAAILSGERIPPRPAFEPAGAPKRRSRWRLLRR